MVFMPFMVKYRAVDTGVRHSRELSLRTIRSGLFFFSENLKCQTHQKAGQNGNGHRQAPVSQAVAFCHF